MRKYNRKEIERLFSKLEEYGYVFPSCLKWSIEDLKSQAEDAGVKFDGKTDDELTEILRDILENSQDWICEAINSIIYDAIKEED